MSQRATPLDFLRVIRPLDWTKNSFVLAGLVFGHRWNEPHLVTHAAVTFAGFCALASGVYVFNDLLDASHDAKHPKKKYRPIAAGRIGPVQAVIVSLALSVGALFAGSTVSSQTLVLFATYLGINLGYTLRFKHSPVLDLFCIASGFVIRVLAGTVGLGIDPSRWILLCTLTLSLFLAASKRRAELEVVGEGRSTHRKVLEHYSPAVLDQIISISAACAIIAYCLYTIDPTTVATHNSDWLIATAPFVVYGILRYVQRLHQGFGGSPAKDLLRDPHLLLTGIGWVATTAWLVL